jgi:regulator of ribonuclease activity B
MNGNSSLLILMLAAIALGLFSWPRIARAQQDPDIQALIGYQSAGSDLSKPHKIEFILFVPTREAAYRLESKLIGLHFETNVAPEKPGLWLVLATKSMVPTHAGLVWIRDQLTTLASAEKGAYSHWNMTVVK